MTLIRLNLRELWMSFRLLLILAALLGGALILAILSSLGSTPGSLTYAVALAGASAVAAAAASYSVAADLRNGPAAWLTVRAVPRSSLILAWLSAFVPPVAAGLLVSAAIAWLTRGGDPTFAASPAPFVLAVTAVFVACFAVVALGVALGTVLPPWPAAVLTAVLALLSAALAFVVPAGIPLPGGGFGLLANLATVDRPTTVALQSMGAGLVAAALLSAAAAAFLQRADL